MQNMKLSALKNRSNTALNYIAVDSLLTELKKAKFMEEHHAAPSKLHRIMEKLQYSHMV
jgi:hypothetical protein